MDIATQLAAELGVRFKPEAVPGEEFRQLVLAGRLTRAEQVRLVRDRLAECQVALELAEMLLAQEGEAKNSARRKACRKGLRKEKSTRGGLGDLLWGAGTRGQGTRNAPDPFSVEE